MKTAIVIGSGAGGAVAAKELQGTYDVTILEEGKDFRPFTMPIAPFEKLRRTRLLFDEKMIELLIPNMVIDKTKDMVLVRGTGIGGTTTLATGNAVRCDGALKKLGIDLDEEFEELYRELPITTDHQKHWTECTKNMYALFEEMGLDPVVTPKFLRPEKCTECGHCAIGCPTGAKWDTREPVEEAVLAGAKLITGCKVTGLKIEDGTVKEVIAKRGMRRETYTADVIVLAAGGLSTPLILENAGIRCAKTLFVDPVLCVAGAIPGISQDRQILMPFISQQDGYILSPYMDYLSFFFNKKWRYPLNGLASIMIKMADKETGDVKGNKVRKTMTLKDNERMDKAVKQAREIMERLGVPEKDQFLGTLNAGHPGGMLPLTRNEKDTLHHSLLPSNLYIADATILPEAMGNPPILTIMALSKKISKIIRGK